MADRPLECSECKKTIAVQYTEIVGENTSCTCMCNDCPILQQRLHGIAGTEASETAIETSMALSCGSCSNNLESVRMGTPLGCENCYNVFGDVLIQEMISSQRISSRLHPEQSKKTKPIHIGRSPGEAAEIKPSLRLIALNEALNDVLTREDYEQAASLRDQIKELTEKTEEPDD